MMFARASGWRRVHAQGWLVLAVLTAATLATFTLLAWRDLETRDETAARQAHDTAWFITRSVDGKFDQIDRQLTLIAAEAGANGDFTGEPVWRMIGLALRTTPEVRSFGLYDREGNIVQHSNHKGGYPHISVADRDYFRTLRDDPDHGPVVTQPLVSRVSGQTVVGVAHAIQDSNGAFVGVALAAVAPEAFDLFASLPNLPRDSAIAIHHRAGANLFRAPALADQIDVDMRASPVFTALRNAPAGLVEGDDHGSMLDGHARILAYRTLTRWPLVVVVGVPQGAVLADWRHDWSRNALLVGLALVGFAWLATAAQRQLTGRLEAELALSRQELRYHAQVEEELRYWANTDALTGMANRRHFLAQCEREMQRAARYGRPLTVAIFDIDWFKRINDGFGHATGDEVLRVIAQATAQSLRETDMAGRLGGEEFGLLLPETGIEGGTELAERLRLAVSSAHIVAKDKTVAVTISIGVATMAADEASVDTLFARADCALYRAKESGRDRVEVATATLG